MLGQWLDMLQARAPGAVVQLVLSKVDTLRAGDDAAEQGTGSGHGGARAAG